MKRNLTFAALFLCTLMTFAQFSGSGAGTENDPYLILNPIQLNQMRNYLNQSGVYFKLMANIDLTEFLEDENPTQGWQPVGTSNNQFKGILDGNGHSITGLWSKRSDYVGLFAYTDGATIKNLSLDVNIEGNNYVGGFAGKSSSTTISGCNISGNINGNQYIGGYAGQGQGIISNNKSSVSIVGKGDYVGGMIGIIHNSTMKDCSVQGYITSSANEVGGLVGFVQDRCTFKNNCFFGRVQGGSYVGGIVGKNYSMSSGTNIYNTFAIADVTASGDYVGGLVGYCYSAFNNFINNYFNGSIIGQNHVGGLIGTGGYVKISNCYSNANVSGDENVGGLVGSMAYSCNIKSCAAINTTVHATVKNGGRIYGKCDFNANVGTIGTTDENKGWNRTLVMVSGVAQETPDGEQHGTNASETTLKLKATYVGANWTFDSDNWAIQETECYPYMGWQTAPPVITSELVANATAISGKCIDGGTVTLEIDGEKKQVVSSGQRWTFDVDPLQAGHEVRVSAQAEGKVPSYFTTQVVLYAGKGTEADPYRVYTAEDLTGVYRKGYYKLMNDIDLTEWINKNSPTEGWTGVGREGSTMTQFDGNGFKITGLWSNSTRNHVGLFSMFSNGTIKNLTVKTASGKKVKGGNCTGVLIGLNTNGKIIDCTVYGDVEGTVNVGGLVGASENNELTNLVYNGTVTSSADNACVGGVVGSSENDQIKGNYSNAIMTTSGASANMGGIAGTANSNIAESVSKGNLTATGENAQVGGIVGTSQANGVVEDCYSSATLNSTYATAGIVSYNYGTVTRSLATGNLSTKNYAAGVVGYNDGANAIVNKSVATNNKIDVVYESQQVSQGAGYGQRIVGGIKNGAPAPEMDNYALKTMQVSVNDAPQKVYDDIMDGAAKTAEQLGMVSTYTELGWDFTSIWRMNNSTKLPELKVNLEKMEQTISLTELPSMKYGDGAYQLPVQTNEGLALTWTIGNSNVASISGNVLTIKKAGTTSVSATQEGNSDYKAFSESFTLTAAKAPLTITAQNCSKNVGEENPVLTVKYDGFVLNENETVLTTQPTIQTEATTDSPVGTYRISVTGAEADNYDITFVSGTLTVVNEIATKNVLAIENVSSRSGVQFTLPVELRNENSITALQFEIVLPAGITISKCQLTDRKGDDHTVSYKKLANGNYQVTAISLSKAIFSGTQGAVVNLTLDVDKGVTIGNYAISLTNIELTTSTTLAINPSDVTATLTVSNIKVGDADGNGKISITDAVAIVSHILGEDIDGFVAAAADVDGNGRITITDAVAVVDMILNGNASAKKRNFVNETLDPQ